MKHFTPLQKHTQHLPQQLNRPTERWMMIFLCGIGTRRTQQCPATAISFGPAAVKLSRIMRRRKNPSFYFLINPIKPLTIIKNGSQLYNLKWKPQSLHETTQFCLCHAMIHEMLLFSCKVSLELYREQIHIQLLLWQVKLTLSAPCQLPLQQHWLNS